MKHDPDTRHLPDVVLERFRLNELPRAGALLIAARIARDEQLRQRLDALRQSDDEIRVSYPTHRFAEAIRRRLRRGESHVSRRSAMFWLVPLTVAAATVVLALVVAQRPSAPAAALPHPDNVPPDADRIKGLTPTLRVYRKTTTRSEMLADGALARNGDVVRVGYEAAGRPYGVILSIDGRGVVTRHLPLIGDLAARLEPSSTVLLDRSYELDDAPRWERFYLITGTSRFGLAPVLEAARAAANLPDGPPENLILPEGLEQSTFSLQKEDTP
jgi:hypothetical protein